MAVEDQRSMSPYPQSGKYEDTEQRARTRITSAEIHLLDFEAFDRLKKLFPDEPDESVARFLIAREYNVEKAADQLGSFISWRSTYFPIYKTDLLKEISSGVIYVHGQDKEGHPLIIYSPRIHNPKESSLEQQVKLSMWWMHVAMSRLPADKSKFTLLIDRTGSGRENMDLEWDKAVLAIFQANYPERLHRCVVYPSGVLFLFIWSVVKFFIDRKTQDKVKPVLYLAGVQEYIDDEFIPAAMVAYSDHRILCSSVLLHFPVVLYREERASTYSMPTNSRILRTATLPFQPSGTAAALAKERTWTHGRKASNDSTIASCR